MLAANPPLIPLVTSKLKLRADTSSLFRPTATLISIAPFSHPHIHPAPQPPLPPPISPLPPSISTTARRRRHLLSPSHSHFPHYRGEAPSSLLSSLPELLCLSLSKSPRPLRPQPSAVVVQPKDDSNNGLSRSIRIDSLFNNEAHPGFHDEVDIEFLGTTFGKSYTLQTNVYFKGSGDGKIIGREMKFQL
ncbi:hypothetical protein PIB30_078300 [Stylosanthes scabra]|uniref:GH16 domain-containing protein n=1 Tax=Stylosanthes scabra TaxID=79078 RepID=A0ABU6XTB4_9FABA|nr:hypothetical protein [Stylosanthes scabra]